jgi:hypothetical protein
LSGAICWFTFLGWGYRNAELLTNATLALLLTTALFFLFPTLGRRSACRRWRTLCEDFVGRAGDSDDAHVAGAGAGLGTGDNRLMQGRRGRPRLLDQRSGLVALPAARRDEPLVDEVAVQGRNAHDLPGGEADAPLLGDLAEPFAAVADMRGGQLHDDKHQPRQDAGQRPPMAFALMSQMSGGFPHGAGLQALCSLAPQYLTEGL